MINFIYRVLFTNFYKKIVFVVLWVHNTTKTISSGSIYHKRYHQSRMGWGEAFFFVFQSPRGGGGRAALELGVLVLISQHKGTHRYLLSGVFIFHYVSIGVTNN